MSSIRDIEGALRCGHELVTDPTLYRKSVDGQVASGLTRAARALADPKGPKLIAARAWLRHFRKDFKNDQRFAVMIAHDKRTVANHWDSVRSLADWALDQLQPHLTEVHGEEE